MNPNDPVLYEHELYTIYACGKSFALIELKDRPFIKKQVRVKDLQKI